MQSEVESKKKLLYINAYICSLEKHGNDGPIFRGHSRGRKVCGSVSSADTRTPPCVKQKRVRRCRAGTGSPAQHPENPDGWDGGVRREGCVCTDSRVSLLYRRNQHNTGNRASSNERFKIT